MAISSIGLGHESTIGVGAAGEVVPGGTFVDIGGKVTGSFSIQSNEVDTTNCDDGGFTSFKPGTSTLTLSVDIRWDPTDTAQGTLRSIAADVDGASFKTLKSWRVKPIVDSGEDEWSFDGYVTNWEINPGEVDGAITATLEVKSVGASIGTAAVYSAQT